MQLFFYAICAFLMPVFLFYAFYADFMQFTQTMVHSCILCTPQLADEVVGGRGTVETIKPQVLFSAMSEVS